MGYTICSTLCQSLKCKLPEGVERCGWVVRVCSLTSASNVGARTPASCLGVGRPHGELGAPVPQGSGGGGGVMARAVEIEDKPTVTCQSTSQVSMQSDEMQKLHHRSGLVTSLAIMYKEQLQ